jgi:phosphoglycolate phosphatase
VVWHDDGVRRMVDVAIFDLDGTLTDSQEGIVASFRHALEAMDLSADDDAIRHQIGPPLVEGFTAFGVSTSQLDFAVSTYRSFFSDTGIYVNRLYEGVEGMLGSIRESGIRLALATSKLTEFAQRILEHFGIAHLFAQVAGSTADGLILTKQSIVADALDRLDHPDPTRVLVVGDRDQDMRAAVAHGLLPIGVTWGYGCESELIQSGALHLVANPAELVRLVLEG